MDRCYNNLTRFKDELETPNNFNEVYNHPEEWERNRWREAIQKELNKMKAHGVWKKSNRNEKPRDRRCVKSRWVFDIKRDGTFRARLVACGYSQIPEIDFQDSYSPVVNDTKLRIMLIMKMIWKLKSILLDIETAFLHGDLDEEIYMECPDGLECEADEILMLLKALYGLIQAARAFYKRLANVFVELGFVMSPVDPCVMTRRNDFGLVILGISAESFLLL